MALKKFWLMINGAKRMVTADPSDTLATVLRRLGLTGTKIGCNAGQCGACTIILNGEAIRSCVRRVKTIKDYDEITTIEGIGTPNNLHPIQVAWNTYGAVQCGYCSPGFIVSAKALLDSNDNPTREEVREWFQKHRNICRCTGYKPIVDATMAAAKVLRGEATIDDITYKIPADGNAYGTRVPRREIGVARVTGLANYGDDIRLQFPAEALELAPVIPDVAHAIIKNIDYSEALKMPGVVGVVTAKDIKGTNRFAFPIGFPRALNTGLERPIICDEKIFKYGDIVAVVAAYTTDQARAAAAKVKVDFEQLPEYESQLEALLPDSVQIHEGVPNVYLEWPKHKGEHTKEIMEKLPHVVEGSFFSAREPHLAIEPDCVNAYVGEDEELTVQYKSQFLYYAIPSIATGVGYPTEKIRMIENESGGSFGYSVSPNLPAIAAACTLALGQPVSMTLTYPEHQHMTGKRTPSHANVRMGADADGKIQAMEYHIGYDGGAYSKFQMILLHKAHFFMGYPYNVPNQLGAGFCTFTNFGYGTTYRAFAAVQALTSSESIVDMLAEECGVDPFEFRYKNIARPGELCATNVEYNDYPFVEMMDKLRPRYEAAKEKAKAKTTDTVKHGVGIAWGGYVLGDPIDNAKVLLEIQPDGSFCSYSTWQDVGQHAENSQLLHTYTALRPMNVPYEKIKIETNDTKLSPDTGLSGGSRMHYHCGNAILDAAEKLMNAMRKADGSYRTYDEMVAENIPTKYEGATSVPQGVAQWLDANTGCGRAYDTLLYALFMAEVQVDVTTGKSQVNGLTCVADVGVVGNLMGVEGQAFGGMSHGVGFALKEDYSDMKKHDNLIGAGVLEIKEMPDDIELIFCENPRAKGPHGSSGCSEAFQSSPHVAVLNGIYNACGVRVYETPAKPEKIKAALDGKDIKPAKYFLGGDLYDVVERLDADAVPEDVNRRFTGV